MSDVGCFVRSTAGRDKGDIFCVLGRDGGMLLLADGKRRRAARPKRKSLNHVQVLTGLSAPRHPTLQKLEEGTPVTDRDLRRLLAAFKEENTLG